MNRKNYTSFLCNLAILSALVGCNVLSMLTGAETKINGKMQDEHFEESYVIFTDGAKFFALDTLHASIHDLGAYPGASEFTFYQNNIFYFDGSTHLRRYDFYTNTEHSVITENVSALEVHQGKLFFKDSSGDLCYLDHAGDTSKDCSGAPASFTGLSWIQSDHITNKLFGCVGSSIKELDFSGQSANTLAPGGTGNAFCNPSSKYYHDGVFVYDDGTSNTETYSTGSNYGSNLVPHANILNMNEHGEIFYLTSGLTSSHSHGGGSTNISDISPQPYPVISTHEKVYFIQSNEVHEAQKWQTGTTNQLTSLGESPYWLARGPGSLFFFHSGGIDELFPDGGRERVSSMGLLSAGYKVIYPAW